MVFRYYTFLSQTLEEGKVLPYYTFLPSRRHYNQIPNTKYQILKPNIHCCRDSKAPMTLTDVRVHNIRRRRAQGLRCGEALQGQPTPHPNMHLCHI